MYYFIIAIVVYISLLFYINIKHSDELADISDKYGVYCICLLLAIGWPILIVFLIFSAFIYYSNLAIVKIIDLLKLK